MKTNSIIGIVLCSCLAITGAHAAKKKEKMPEVWRDMDVPPAPVVEPVETLKNFRIAPGFKVELVAAEPLIANPVVIRWDGNGRLWVVEMTGYMPDSYGKGENELKTGRVSVLHDRDGDGRMDDSTVFLDGLVMPRAMAFVEGGVLVAEPPTLWYCQDTDGDLVCDKKEKVANYAKVGPVEHTDNALFPALDNWMYNAKSSRTLQFRDGKVIEKKTRSRGQWGITQDNYGRLFYTSNSRYLYGDWGQYHNIGSKGLAYGTASKGIHSIRINPGINRGYQSKMLREDGRLARVTAISGPGVYRGTRYPEEYHGGLFIPEPAANALTFHRAIDEPGKLRIEHQIYEDPDWGHREFLASTDERFRPVSIESGPDGCIYVVDLYHGILQHRVYVTPFLRTQIHERKLDQENLRGRIYRIVHEDAGRDTRSFEMETASTKTLVKSLADSNGWVRDTAQRLLVQRDDEDAPAMLAKLLTTEQPVYHLSRIHSLWALEGLGALEPEAVMSALEDPHPRVRLTALAIAAGWDKEKVSPELITAVQHSVADVDPEVKELAGYVLKRLTGTGATEVDENEYTGELKKDGLAQYERGREVYSMFCGNCHQANGKGLEGLAPPLVESEWVSGTPGRMIRIALDGVQGPIHVNGKKYEMPPIMPGHRAILDDQKIGDVLTYIRNSWGNKDASVSKNTVADIREGTADRAIPYTEAELLKVE